MSKKIFMLFAVLTMVFVFAVGAFASDVFVRIGTGSIGGGFYQIGNTIAQLGNRELGNFNFTAVTGGSVKNSFNLGKKDVELGLVQSATLMDAWNGTGPFDGKAVKKLRFITAIYPMPFHILVNNKAEIKNIADFKGKRIDFGPMGGGIEVNTNRILSVYNITDKDVNVQRFGKSESSEALKTGRSEAQIWATSVPNAMVTDMVGSGKVGLIALEEDKIKDIVAEYPAYTGTVIPGGIYKGYDNDLPVVAAVGTLLTYADMDEEAVYQITKMLYEHSDFLKERLDYFKHFNIDNALGGMVCPLHPGAKRFYVEKGLIKE